MKSRRVLLLLILLLFLILATVAFFAFDTDSAHAPADEPTFQQGRLDPFLRVVAPADVTPAMSMLGSL